MGWAGKQAIFVSGLRKFVAVFGLKEVAGSCFWRLGRVFGSVLFRIMISRCFELQGKGLGSVEDWEILDRDWCTLFGWVGAVSKGVGACFVVFRGYSVRVRVQVRVQVRVRVGVQFPPPPRT